MKKAGFDVLKRKTTNYRHHFYRRFHCFHCTHLDFSDFLKRIFTFMEVFLIYGDQAIKFSKFQDLKEIATIIILSILLEAIKF